MAVNSRVFQAPAGSGFSYSYRLYQPAEPAAGLVAYLPHYGGTIDEFENVQLPALLVARRIALLVGVTVAAGTGFIEDSALLALQAMLVEALDNAGSPPGQLVLGGFSAGGLGAVRYALAAATALALLPSAIRPRAVFAVDPPLDLRRWIRGMELVVQRGYPSIQLPEARAILADVQSILGGSPVEAPENYARVSPVLAFEPGGGNIRHLRDTPMRLYAEPDINYYINELACDYYTMNAIDLALAINELRILGNTRAELIVTSGRGYRPELGGKRMPHAWSIVPESDLAAWIQSNLQ